LRPLNSTGKKLSGLQARKSISLTNFDPNIHASAFHSPRYDEIRESRAALGETRTSGRPLFAVLIDGKPAPFLSPIKVPGDSYEPRCAQHFVLPGRPH